MRGLTKVGHIMLASVRPLYRLHQFFASFQGEEGKKCWQKKKSEKDKMDQRTKVAIQSVMLARFAFFFFFLVAFVFAFASVMNELMQVQKRERVGTNIIISLPCSKTYPSPE